MERLSTMEKRYFMLYDRGWTQDWSQSSGYVRSDLDFMNNSGLFVPLRGIEGTVFYLHLDHSYSVESV